MSESPARHERVRAKPDQLMEHVDSVYFLLVPGWEQELRANRWHFAVRWARHRPVVLVTPVLTRGDASSVPEPRIANARILRTQLVSEPNELAKAQVQLGQVLADMARHRFTKPLLWCYNPDLAELYAHVPAVARVYHASEAYFDMPGRGQRYLQRLGAVVAMSDLTVAVSDGVAAGLAQRVEAAPVVTVTNGCDYAHYSQATPDAELLAAGGRFDRIAVYAGNVNGRLDYSLVEKLVGANPGTLFAFYGPVRDLSARETASWRELCGRPNFIAAGPVDPDRIRDLYGAADVGIIPYRQDPWLVENGLPLKALEMAATGLPVVSSLMKGLLGLASKIIVTSSSDEFLTEFRRTSRKQLGAAAGEELRRVAAANDYDKKFEAVLSALDDRITRTQAVTAVDRLSQTLGREWVEAQIRYARWLSMPASVRGLGRMAGRAGLLLPARVRRSTAAGRLRAAMRQLLGS